MEDCAFIIVDLQNDIVHNDGVFAKNGLFPPNLEKIISNISNVMQFCQKIKVPIIATQLTVLENLNKEPIGLGSLHNIYPFLEKEGFRNKTWGHDILEELLPADYKIKKWGISTFYNTEFMQYILALRCKKLVISGFGTNGSVETLAREAFCRDLNIYILSDCTLAYSETLHLASLNNLKAFGNILTSLDWIKQFST